MIESVRYKIGVFCITLRNILNCDVTYRLQETISDSIMVEITINHTIPIMYGFRLPYGVDRGIINDMIEYKIKDVYIDICLMLFDKCSDTNETNNNLQHSDPQHREFFTEDNVIFDDLGYQIENDLAGDDLSEENDDEFYLERCGV